MVIRRGTTGNDRAEDSLTERKAKVTVVVAAAAIVLSLGMVGRDGGTPVAAQPMTLDVEPAVAVPPKDVRLRPDFLKELIAHKKDFRPPQWATPGRARQIRFDGGPMFAACQFESGWEYLTDPNTPGFVGMIKSVWTLTNLYTDDIERRLDEIREAGYNWLWVSYQLGYAFDDEARQRAQVRRLIQLAHARGLRVTAYFSLTSVFTTSSFTGMPESKEWIQENADGTPIAYANIPHRLMACVNKPGRLEYLKKVVKMAVEDGADDIFYDSIFNRCYCEFCEEEFRKYTERVLGNPYSIPRPAASAKESQFDITENYRFAGLNSSAMEALFTEYSHYASAKAIAELDRYAKSINPMVLTSANTHRFRYVDDVVDLTWNEDANRRGGRIDEDGHLTTPLGMYAWGQAVSEERKTAQFTVAPHEYWQLQRPDYYEQAIAAAASFQVNFTMLGGYAFAVRFDHDDPVAKRAWDGISTGLNFVAAHPDLFEHARSAADVAVYYSHPSRLNPNDASEASVGWLDVVQNLFLAGIPTKVVTDEMAVRTGAKALRDSLAMIVLAGTPCLSDEEIALFKEYTRLGGRLLISGDAGSCTSFWTPRAVAPWPSSSAAVRLVRREEIDTPQALGTTVQQFLNRPAPVAIAGNGYQFGNPTLVGGQLVLHIINYDRSRHFTNLPVTLAVPAWRKDVRTVLAAAKRAVWLSPRAQGEEEVDVTWHGDQARITVPRLDVSGVLVLSPK